MAAYTKGDLVSMSYEELALAGYEFDLSPEDKESALRRLDSMMAQWDGRGIRLGYPLAGNGKTSSLNQSANLPDMAVEAVVTNLAVKLAPANGKVTMADTKAGAKEGYNMLLARATQPPQMKLPSTMPLGAGNKPWTYTEDMYVLNSPPGVAAGTDNDIDV